MPSAFTLSLFSFSLVYINTYTRADYQKGRFELITSSFECQYPRSTSMFLLDLFKRYMVVGSETGALSCNQYWNKLSELLDGGLETETSTHNLHI